MGQYRFVGGAPAQIMGTPFNFTAYGQLVEMEDEMAKFAVGGRISIIPASEFTGTPEEIKKYARFDSHKSAPAEFQSNRDRHWDLAAEYSKDPDSIIKSNPTPTEGGK
jgi:hypothetical protein